MIQTFYCAFCAEPIEVDTDKDDICDVAWCDETAMAKYVWAPWKRTIRTNQSSAAAVSANLNTG